MSLKGPYNPETATPHDLTLAARLYSSLMNKMLENRKANRTNAVIVIPLTRIEMPEHYLNPLSGKKHLCENATRITYITSPFNLEGELWGEFLCKWNEGTAQDEHRLRNVELQGEPFINGLPTNGFSFTRGKGFVFPSKEKDLSLFYDIRWIGEYKDSLEYKTKPPKRSLRLPVPREKPCHTRKAVSVVLPSQARTTIKEESEEDVMSRLRTSGIIR